MSLIQITDLSFSYDGGIDLIFDHASFQLDTNWRLGLIGRNGRGKTTFLRLLQGRYPYQGSISASVRFSYFPYPAPGGNLTGLAAARQMRPECEDWRLLREMRLLQLDEGVLSRPYDTLSGGEQVKLQLALLFSGENEFLLIDEPTNHLDLHGRALVSRYLQTKRGFILVSHDRAFLDGCIDHVLSIGRAAIDVQRGNFSSWYENRQRQDAYELAENEKLKKEIGRLKQSAQQKAQWADRAEQAKRVTDKVDMVAGHRPYQAAKAKKSMARAKAISQRQQAAVEEKSRLLKQIETVEPLKLTQLSYPAGKLALFQEVSVCYDGIPVCQSVSFSVERSDRIALLGANGTGKTSLLRLLMGEELPHCGLFQRGSGLAISYVPQSAAHLRGSLRAFVQECEIEESLFFAVLSKLGLPRSLRESSMERMSAGQKKKVLLARSICQRAHLYIWDEPLNDIDLLSRIQLEQLLLNVQPTILFVEHDAAFCDAVATKTIVLTKER